MSEFDFISQKTEYENIYHACCKAENETNLGKKAELCREALSEIIKFLYEKEYNTWKKLELVFLV